MTQDPELRAHQEWRGYLQPIGLVVSPAALRDAQAFVNKNIVREQSVLIRHVMGESTVAALREEQPSTYGALYMRVRNFDVSTPDPSRDPRGVAPSA